MRQKIIASFVLLLLCSTFLVVVSDTARAPQDGDYNYNVNNGVATIINYTGVSGDITIPSSLGGYPTVAIGDNAFNACTFLTSVTIPDTVTTIGDDAFFSCTSLTSITFLGLVAPTNVGSNWILGTPVEIRGHAYATSDFPGPGVDWNGLTMGDYILLPNNPPVFGTSSPVDGSTGNPLSLAWSITINDLEGDLFSWTIQCSNGQTTSGTDETNGTKSLSLSGLASLTTYTVWVNATDPAGSGQYTRNWFTFTTTESLVNNPPVFSTPSPANGSTGNPTSLTWSIQINDPEENAFTWRIECNNGQSNSDTGASNGTKSLVLSGLAYSTAYTVWVNATDLGGSDQWTHRWYTFTTVTSSGDPSNLNAQNPTSSSISLSWTKGSDSDYTMIRRSTTGYPTSSTSGTQAYYGTGTSTTDSSLSNGQIYYYRAWAYSSSSGQYSSGYASDSEYTLPGTPSSLNAYNPTVNSISLSWSKGTGGEYTMIRRSTGSYPSAPTSGTQAYYGTGTSTTDSGLSPGTYYYRAWARDSDSNYYSSAYSQDYETISQPINSPPAFGTPSPANLSTNNPISLTWSIPINDPEGNTFSWTIQCSNQQTNSATDTTNGTKSLSLSGLTNSTTYNIWVNATDPTGSNRYTRRWYTFTTKPRGNIPPVFGLPSPANGSIGNPLSLSWNIPINDLEGNTFSWTIQCSNQQTNSATDTTNGTKSLSLSGLTNSTTYNIWVNATDPTGSGNYTRNWYTFTTNNSGDGDGGGDDGAEIPNKKPIANASAGEPYQGFVNIEILFDGSASYDPDGIITKYEWSFGDNTTATEATPTHTYQKEGNYTVTLTVTDNNGTTAQNTTYALITITQNHPPNQPHLTGSTQGTITTQYNLTLHTTDPDNDTIYYTIHWSNDTNITITDFVPSGTTITVTHQWTKPGIYTIKAYTTDRNNATSETIEFTVLINVHYVNTIGYLIDTQNDGTYDTFYFNTTKNITLAQHNNNYYLIDTNNDGYVDYQYNIVTGELNSYSAEQPTNQLPSSNTLILLTAIAVIILVTLALVVNRKRKKQLPEKTTPEEIVDDLYDQRKIYRPNRTNVLFNEIQQKINQPTKINIPFNKTQPQVNAPKIADGLNKEIKQKIDTSKITDEQIKEIQQKIDELSLNDKGSHNQ